MLNFEGFFSHGYVCKVYAHVPYQLIGGNIDKKYCKRCTSNFYVQILLFKQLAVNLIEFALLFFLFQCVKLSKFESERSISFIPPDGEYELMRYDGFLMLFDLSRCDNFNNNV